MTDSYTDVKPGELNYEKYAAERYERDICAVIPGHKELHDCIVDIVTKHFGGKAIRKVADLGVGTGLSSEVVMKLVPKAKLTAVDFCEQMLKGARKRLAAYDVHYIVGDYSQIDFGREFDIILTVIGLHHQSDEGKQKIFKKIYESLMPNGLFILGDLVTYSDQKKAAVNEAKDYAHLVNNAPSEEALIDWAYHHKFLNHLTPLENQLAWLKQSGFKKVNVEFEHYNTVLILAEK